MRDSENVQDKRLSWARQRLDPEQHPYSTYKRKGKNTVALLEKLGARNTEKKQESKHVDEIRVRRDDIIRK
eukprot:151749-Pleurochrysis_carterae.AAC.1